MMRTRLRSAVVRAAGFTFVAFSSPLLHAQASEGEAMHWGYAAFFGTGWYSLDGGGDTFALRIKPRWRWREPELDEDGNRRFGVQFNLAATLGFHRLDHGQGEIGDFLGIDEASTISFVPGIEFEIPINARWSLKPLAYAGWGTEFNGDSSAWIYWGGIKSRVTFGSGNLQWALVNSLSYVGYAPDKGKRGELVPFLTGFEFQRPLGDKKLGGEQVYLNWHVAYTTTLDTPGLQVGTPGFSTANVEDLWDLGIAFSKGQRPLSFWRLRWDRVGLAVKFNSDNSFEGLSVTFRSIFDR